MVGPRWLKLLRNVVIPEYAISNASMDDPQTILPNKDDEAPVLPKECTGRDASTFSRSKAGSDVLMRLSPNNGNVEPSLALLCKSKTDPNFVQSNAGIAGPSQTVPKAKGSGSRHAILLAAKAKPRSDMSKADSIDSKRPRDITNESSSK